MAPLGITRLADVTGLDDIGIPVVQAIRPNARSLSVSQGKGLDHDAATASALGESIELWHAEHIDAELRLGTWREMRSRRRVVDVESLPRQPGAMLHPDLAMLWIEGTDLIDESAHLGALRLRRPRRHPPTGPGAAAASHAPPTASHPATPWPRR